VLAASLALLLQQLFAALALLLPLSLEILLVRGHLLPFPLSVFAIHFIEVVVIQAE
jgi:hypothetical protein